MTKSFSCQEQGQILQISSLQYSRKKKCHHLKVCVSFFLWHFTFFIYTKSEHGLICTSFNWWVSIKLVYDEQTNINKYLSHGWSSALFDLAGTQMEWVKHKHFLLLLKDSKCKCSQRCLPYQVLHYLCFLKSRLCFYIYYLKHTCTFTSNFSLDL